MIKWREFMPTVDLMTDDSPDRHREVIARVTRRLIPFAFICYVVAYIDRVNVGFAATVLQRDLGLTDSQYGHGAGLFFLGTACSRCRATSFSNVSARGGGLRGS